MKNPMTPLVIAGAALFGLGGCETFEESRMSIAAPASVPADGASIYDVEVCAIADDIGDVTVRLEASSGEWLVPPDPTRPAETFVPLDPMTLCATDRWIVPDDLRPVRFRALVGGEALATAETNLTLTRIEGVEFSPSSPFLSGAAETVITLDVRGRVAVDGETAGMPGPTIGSRVTLDVQSDPPNSAAVNDSVIIFGSAQSRTLIAAAGTRQVTVTARDGRGGRTLGELVLRIAGP